LNSQSIICGAIVAVNPDRVIGIDGGLPWHYSEDLKRFKRLTLGSTIIMGRHTWESIGGRPLPGRRNLVLSRRSLGGIETFAQIGDALATCEGEVWFIGGGQVYAAALPFCQWVDVTFVPDLVSGDHLTYFPELDPEQWQAGEKRVLEGDPRLSCCRYTLRHNSAR
jgi:dihydrofolate reductase|tara:strand:- start:1756 stop:2253 length:498 start_codon:yes stop_codon:yes gene_type:complete